MRPKSYAETQPGWRRIACADADLWLIDIATGSAALREASRVLSADEMDRAEHYRHLADRARFMLTRAALRHLLADATGVEARALAFSLGRHGRPELFGAEPLQLPDLRFNASHSGRLGLVGLSRGRAIGVDIEEMRDGVDELTLAATFFRDSEHRFLQGLEGGARLEAFYRIWTCKEAVLKAFGVGVTARLKDFSVNLRPESVSLEPAPDCFAPTMAEVRAAGLVAPVGYAAAYALA